MDIQVEIRPGEGGKDAELLVYDHANIYIKYAQSQRIECDVSFENNVLTLFLEGHRKNLAGFFYESGGHRYQRIPPTERRGRIHTSTVTVAVLEGIQQNDWTISDKDIEYRTTRDSGPGGQHRNTTDSCVYAKHIPTGIEVKSATKSQHRNRILARSMLEARIKEADENLNRERVDTIRRNLVGSGMRGDKIRTYRFKDGIVIDHRSEKKYQLKSILEGRLNIIWRDLNDSESSIQY